MNKILAITILIFLIPTGLVAQSAQPTGFWHLNGGKFGITINHCGYDLCGTLEYLRDPLDRYGRPKTDIENSNPDLRNRPLLGVPLLLSLRSSRHGEWVGQIYNPDDGRTYDATLSVIGPDRLNVEGCVLAVLCKNISLERAGY